jgi:hypothetical protein
VNKSNSLVAQQAHLCNYLKRSFSFNTNFTSNAAEMHGGVASAVDGLLELEGGYLSLNIAGGLHPAVHLVGSAKATYKAVHSDLNNGINLFLSSF